MAMLPQTEWRKKMKKTNQTIPDFDRIVYCVVSHLEGAQTLVRFYQRERDAKIFLTRALRSIRPSEHLWIEPLLEGRLKDVSSGVIMLDPPKQEFWGIRITPHKGRAYWWRETFFANRHDAVSIYSTNEELEMLRKTVVSVRIRKSRVTH